MFFLGQHRAAADAGAARGPGRGDSVREALEGLGIETTPSARSERALILLVTLAAPAERGLGPGLAKESPGGLRGLRRGENVTLRTHRGGKESRVFHD